jgi:predicted nucleotidyltransferase
MLSEADIERIAARIAAGCDPLVVGTFGSYAVGRAQASSDLDLFVILRTAQPRASRRRSVARYLFGIMYPLDVHVFTPGEFEEEAREHLSFAWVILRQARLYHWKAEAAAQVPSLLEAADNLRGRTADR